MSRTINDLDERNFRLSVLDDRGDRVGGRSFDVIHRWSNRHIAAGSLYVGSWDGTTAYARKAMYARSSMGGSLHVIYSMSGTSGPFTGTLSSSRLGPGSSFLTSFEHPVRFVRAAVRVGDTGSGKGTLSAAISRQT